MRKPSVRSVLQPGQLVTNHGKPSLVVSRPKESQLSAEQMDASLDKLASKCPKIDTLEVVKQLRK